MNYIQVKKKKTKKKTNRTSCTEVIKISIIRSTYADDTCISLNIILLNVLTAHKTPVMVTQ
jgi:hypothetical protein